MPLYKRICPVSAIKFHEKDYAEDSSKYPDVFDRFMMSELWWDKTAADGRYYIVEQAPKNCECLTVEENDYIVHDDYGVTYVIPSYVFEMKYKEIKKED